MLMKSAKRLLLLATAASAFAVAPLGPSAEAQTFRASIGCSIGTLPADITADQLRDRCFNPARQPAATGGGTTDFGAIPCGALKFMASRASVGFPEGHSASAAFNANCQGKPEDHVPPPPNPTKLDGQYKFVRGYSSRNPGVNTLICESSYEGTASVRDGTITFNSGGHQWTGVVTNNKWVLISRDGIDPRPKNPTVITGPIENASLYNGYCGRGFFRISAR